MQACVVTNGVEPGKMDEWLILVRDGIVPALDGENGFLGLVALVDREHDQSIGCSIWESGADLAHSEARGHYQAQIAKRSGVLAEAPVREAWELNLFGLR